MMTMKGRPGPLPRGGAAPALTGPGFQRAWTRPGRTLDDQRFHFLRLVGSDAGGTAVRSAVLIQHWLTDPQAGGDTR